MATKISVTATDANDNKITKTLPDVNPSADDAKLKTWAQGLNALTTNTVQGISRVDKTDLLNGDASTKLPRNMHLTTATAQPQEVTTISAATLPTEDMGSMTFYLKYDGVQTTDRVFICFDNPNRDGDLYFNLWEMPSTSIGGLTLYMWRGTEGDVDFTGTKLIFYLAETDTYAAETLEIPVTN